MKSKTTLIILAALFILQSTRAEVRLPSIIGSNMVLQRNTECRIWGWAGNGEEVTVSFRDTEKSTRADNNGRWEVTLPPMKEGGPFRMTISGKNEIVLDNILIGDVWVCSGQSNMEFSLSRAMNAEEEIQQADYPQIRLFTAPNNIQFEPAEDTDGGQWQECNPGTAAGFSAVGYFFGRHIHRELGIPVGLLNTSWGGTVVETWISGESIRQVEEFSERVANLKGAKPEEEIARRKAELEALVKKYGGDEPGMVEGRALWAVPDLDMSGWGEMELPTLWESAGLEGLDGVVWFRKEFTLGEEEAGEDLVLELGPIDDSDMTWVNGHKVGEMKNAYDQPRIYKVPAAYLKTGRNVLAVRVEDTGGGGGLYGEENQMKISSSAASVSLAGKWHFRVSPVDLTMNINNFISPNSNPTLLYNGMIHPFIKFPVRGAIWYQGESNAGRAYQYRTLFPLLITDWRDKWNNPEMPFFFVQLANYMQPKKQPGESQWAELREAQLMTLSLPNTGMAVIIDIGEADDIHPRNKQDVGYRLALPALHVAYGKDAVYSGPVFREMILDGPDVILEFDHTGSGLMVKDKYGYVKGFAMAGNDRKFYWARGSIRDNKVVLNCAQVPKPVAVRYGWADNPDDQNLYNKDGLPATPFRTDDWPGLTYGRK